MTKKKAYKPTLASFKKWCKDHPWNTKFAEEAEYKFINGVFVELTLNDNSDGSLTAFTATREFDAEENTFQLIGKLSIEETTQEKITKAVQEFVKKHNAVNVVD